MWLKNMTTALHFSADVQAQKSQKLTGVTRTCLKLDKDSARAGLPQRTRRRQPEVGSEAGRQGRRAERTDSSARSPATVTFLPEFQISFVCANIILNSTTYISSG